MGRSLLAAATLVIAPLLFGLALSRIIHWWVGFWMVLIPMSEERFSNMKKAYGGLFNTATEIFALWALGILFLGLNA